MSSKAQMGPTSSKTFHGSRAVLNINGKVVGIFNSVDWAVNLDVQPVNILGRFNTAELATTGMEPVSVNVSGFRVYENGPYTIGGVPALRDLLDNAGDVTISIFDRQNRANVLDVYGCKATGWSCNVAARALSTLSINFLGLKMADETTGDDDDSTAVNLA